MALVSFTTPLPAAGQATSGTMHVDRATALTGTVYADVDGTIYVDQGGDGLNWDTTVSAQINGGVGQVIDIPIVSQYWQVRYINGSTPQTTLRVYVDARDPYGEFLTKALAPSTGGQYAVLLWDANNNIYRYLGRFDGDSTWGAITNAAINQNQNGKYAACDVSLFTVSDEIITKYTDHTPDYF